MLGPTKKLVRQKSSSLLLFFVAAVFSDFVLTLSLTKAQSRKNLRFLCSGSSQEIRNYLKIQLTLLVTFVGMIKLQTNFPLTQSHIKDCTGKAF